MTEVVSYEIAKILKEKGFDEQCLNFYTKPNSKMFGIDEHGRYYPIKNKAKSLWILGNAATLNIKNIYQAPTIAQIIDWLYEKHNIWISVENIDNSTIFRHCFSNINFNSPTNAYLAGIEYTLKNLI